jgi:hypothetical protein
LVTSDQSTTNGFGSLQKIRFEAVEKGVGKPTISDMYRMTMADSKPTPTPATRRPTTIAARAFPAPVII